MTQPQGIRVQTVRYSFAYVWQHDSLIAIMERSGFTGEWQGYLYRGAKNEHGSKLFTGPRINTQRKTPNAAGKVVAQAAQDYWDERNAA